MHLLARCALRQAGTLLQLQLPPSTACIAELRPLFKRRSWMTCALHGLSTAWQRPSSGGAATVAVDEARRLLTVAWPDASEEASVMPLSWLRDSCQCRECFNSATKSRTLHFKDFDPRVPVKSVTLSADSSCVTVEWQDGHLSSYAKSWLQERSFTEQARLKRQSKLMFTEREKSWSQEMASFNYSELMSDDAVLLKLLRHLDRCGTLMVKEAPAEPSVLRNFGDRLAGFLSPSNYGHTFEVKSKSDPSNAAYTSGYLGLHIDQSFYSRRPGVQILHCISQPSDGSIRGGESLMADGFTAASALKRRWPEYFKALTSLPLDFNDYGTDFVGNFHLINRETVLRLNSMGEVDRVTFSGHSRDYYQNHLPAEQVQLLYNALKAFYEILSKPPCLMEHKMQTGDIQLTDNRRVLHGRRAFSVVGNAERFLHGGYVEWDEVYSRIRRLEEKLEGPGSLSQTSIYGLH